MNKYLLYFLLLGTISFSLTECRFKEKEKDEDVPSPMPPYVPPGQLPPETQEGWDFFGCRVNGEVWVPRTGSLPVHADYENGEFFVTGQKILPDGSVEQISVGHMQLYSVGNYQLKDINTSGAISMFSNCTYITDTVNTGQLIITKLAYDPVRLGYIISGRFHFTVVTPGCDTLRVTDGRFDIFD